jgi:hypothetical protein
MPDGLIITPVKNSIQTTLKTIESVSALEGNFLYIVFNDFSDSETKSSLERNSRTYGYELVNIEDYTTHVSPNYWLILQLGQQKALSLGIPLIIVESDVVVKKDTIKSLISISEAYSNAGMIAAITVNENNEYNFPYTFVKEKNNDVVISKHRLSFSCTILTLSLLKKINLENLPKTKDWFDVYLSHQSKKYGFVNILAKNLEVFHLPHSSRPWKKLKYERPVLYYIQKYLKQRDRI